MTENTPTSNRETSASTDLVVPESLPVRAEPPKVVHRSPPPCVWLALGVGIGVIGTAVAFSNWRTKAVPGTHVALNASVPPMAVGKPATGGAPETISPPTGGAALTPKPVEAAKEPTPVNPFGGSAFVLPKLPVPKGTPALSGMILPKQLPPIPTNPILPRSNPAASPAEKSSNEELDALIAKGLPKAPPALKPPKRGAAVAAKPTKADSTLVTVNQLANNRQDAADDLIAYVQKLGGKGQPLTEQGSDNKPSITGVLATVPDKAVPDLMKHVADAGAVVEKQTWSGSTAERRAKLAEDAQARLASLKKLREALLVTYLEDADPVKDVDEEIAKASKSLDQLQTDKASDGMTIVRISFVAK